MNKGFRSDRQRALVTGLAGFTGQYVARELREFGYEVYGTSHSSKSSDQNVYRVDLCESMRLARVVEEIQPDVVVHLAAIAFVAHGNPEEIYRTNVIGTRNLLDALVRVKRRPKMVLLASSANIYGNSPVEIIDESVPPAPANDYAVSKVAMEYMARLWMDRLPINIVRPFNYTGVGQSDKFLLPKIVNHFRRGERAIELGNIDVERDFADVRYIAKAYSRLLQLQTSGGIFNVCSGRAISLKAVIAIMESIAGYSIDVCVNPEFVRPNEIRKLQGNGDRLRKVIGENMDIPLEETLSWMYRGID